MLPLQRSDELVPHPIISASMPTQQDQIQEDLIFSGHASAKTTNTKRRKGHLSHVQVSDDENNMEYKLKRIMHRDVERQRRQEMANLHASLRSLLPIEYIKGKRSISDHMHEAGNYINHLQKNIKQLHIRRDKLKKLSEFGVENKRKLDCGSINCVTISTYEDGVEILISSNLKEEIFPLSKVLSKLLDEGLSVVSYISTREKERSLHRIQSEVSVMTCIDLTKLETKIADELNQDFNSD